MAPKRKSNAADLDFSDGGEHDVNSDSHQSPPPKKAKKARKPTSDAPAIASSSASKENEKTNAPQTWQDVKLDGEDKEKGKTDGASNGTYYAAYVYFEKVRILEGKKKTPKRQSNEKSMPNGFPLENRRYGWVRG
ncbi:hypothetical protein H0H81_003776 [Sphagnurus paluster]|uniref:Uncharacterized protein n=1 Tax=Sphagnurus paluster TaxID=117069 RepID=A0A9P7GUM4_9AGAR|nr:hypothetical protein H0H81_003776 [Sphagnurus paluster]